MRQHWAITIGLIAVALFLGLHRVANEAVWYDEVFTIEAARDSWGGMARRLMRDNAHPLLHTAIVKVFELVVGQSVFAARLPSFLASIGTLLILLRLAWRFAEYRPGIYAAMCFLTVNWNFLHYMQECRAYSLFVMLTCLLMYLFLDPKPSFLKIFVVSALLVNTHYFAVLYISGLCLASLQRERIYPALLGSTTLIPWFAIVATNPSFDVGMGMNELPLPGFREVYYVAGSLLTSVRTPVVQLASFFVLLGIAAWSLRSQVPLLRYTAALCIFAPAAGYLLTRWPLEMHIFLFRYYLPSQPFAMLLLGVAIFRCLPLRNAVLVASLVMAANTFETWRYRQHGSRIRFDVISREIGEGRLPALPLYCGHSLLVCRPINFYCQRDCILSVPADLRMPEHFLLAGRPGRHPDDSRPKLIEAGFVASPLKTYSRYPGGAEPDIIIEEVHRPAAKATER